jgi:hypothetical protein
MHKPSTPEANVRLLQIMFSGNRSALLRIFISSLSNRNKEEKVLAYQKLDIDNLTNDQCRTMFRFEREDINILSNALRLPEKFICYDNQSRLRSERR